MLNSLDFIKFLCFVHLTREDISKQDNRNAYKYKYLFNSQLIFWQMTHRFPYLVSKWRMPIDNLLKKKCNKAIIKRSNHYRFKWIALTDWDSCKFIHRTKHNIHTSSSSLGLVSSTLSKLVTPALQSAVEREGPEIKYVTCINTLYGTTNSYTHPDQKYTIDGYIKFTLALNS